jgi:hypothetical protein
LCWARSLSKPGWLCRLKRSALLAEMARVQSVAEPTVLMGHDLSSLCSVGSGPVCGNKPAGVRPCEWRNIMSDPVKRAERWKAKYNVERVKDTLNDIREDMGKRYEAAIAEVCIMEGKVKETLNTCGVSTSLYVPYLLV